MAAPGSPCGITLALFCLPLEEAKELYFGAYSNNAAKKPDWRTGLFRYLEDGQVHRILTDVAATVRDEQTKKEVDALIQQAFKAQEAPAAQGCPTGAERESTCRHCRPAKITTMLLAWNIPAEVRAFCDKYGILWRESRLSKLEF